MQEMYVFTAFSFSVSAVRVVIAVAVSLCGRLLCITSACGHSFVCVFSLHECIKPAGQAQGEAGGRGVLPGPALLSVARPDSS